MTPAGGSPGTVSSPCSPCSPTSTASTASTSRRTATSTPTSTSPGSPPRAAALLPLRSDYLCMRNTKPPLLFWQGIASTGGGRRLDAGEPALPERGLHAPHRRARVRGSASASRAEQRRGLRGGARASSPSSARIRYGRPFLTNAPEVFWLFLPFFALLSGERLRRPLASPSRSSRGARSASPCCTSRSRSSCPPGSRSPCGTCTRETIDSPPSSRRIPGGSSIAITIALAMFGPGSLLDPDPGACGGSSCCGRTWASSTCRGAISHGSSGAPRASGALALGYPVNAGLLFFPVMALFVLAWRRREELERARARALHLDPRHVPHRLLRPQPAFEPLPPPGHARRGAVARAGWWRSPAGCSSRASAATAVMRP